jgi:hypothetical protein
MVAPVLAALLSLGNGSCEKGTGTGPGGSITVKGVLTTEGAECPALRDGKNVLYTLSGSLGGFRPGDRVCVKGKRAEISHCMQGITINVESIGPEADCP